MKVPWGPICEKIDNAISGLPTVWMTPESIYNWPRYLDYDKEYKAVPHYHSDPVQCSTAVDLFRGMGWYIFTGKHDGGYRVNVMTPEGNQSTAFCETLEQAIVIALYLAL